MLLAIASLGQGWLLRQQKADFVSTLFPDTSQPASDEKIDSNSVYLSSYDTSFRDSPIKEIGIRTVSTPDDLPTGLDRVPSSNELWVTPALKQLIDTNELLRGRYQGLNIKSEFPEQLASSPDSLMLLYRIPDTALQNSQAQIQITNKDSINKIYNDQKAKSDSQTQLLRTALMVIGIVLVTPVLILITEVARINMTQRERKYASLSLVGATVRQVRSIIVLESLPLSIIGALLGLILFVWLGAPILSHIPLGEGASWDNDLRLPAFIYGIVGALTMVCVLLANLQAVRRIKLSPLAVSRSNGVRKPPSVVTLFPLALGAGGMYILGWHGSEWYANNAEAGSLIIASLLLLIIIGIFIGGSYITYLASLIMTHVARRAGGVMAAHRLRSISRNSFRSVSGIVIALFAGALLMTFLATAQSSSERQLEIASSTDTTFLGQLRHPLQIEVTESSLYDIDDSLVEALSSNEAVKTLSAQTYVQKIFQGYEGSESPVQGRYYDSCQQLEDRTETRCTESIRSPVVVVQQIVTDDSGVAHMQSRVTPVSGTEGEIHENSYVIIAKDQAAYAHLLEFTENIASVHQRETGTITSVEHDQSNSIDITAYVKSLSGLITLMLTAVIITGGLSIFVSVVGNIYERRKTFVQLRVLGANLTVLVHSLIIEIVAPLVLLSAVAIGLGIFCCYSILSTVGAFNDGLSTFTFMLPDFSFWASLCAAIILCASFSLVVVPILARLTKEDIRVE
jgi:ABC-type antimicrobial peptide transport system permease subunit